MTTERITDYALAKEAEALAAEIFDEIKRDEMDAYEAPEVEA